MWNKFIAWVKLFFAPDNEFMPDDQWKDEHERINEDPNIIDEPLAEALKDENEAGKRR